MAFGLELRRWRLSLAVTLGVTLAAGCRQPHSTGLSRNDLDLAARALPVETARYARAADLARTAGPEAISRELLALSPAQDGIWKHIGGKPHVLMATWTSYTAYPDPGEEYNDRDYEIWVTAVPEMKDFVRAYRPAGREPTEHQLTDRLEQLLGLPPHADHALVVEMWVPPERLFRPSADPEISDHEAQLQFPDVVDSGQDLPVPYLAVSEAYRDWYEGQVRSRYHPEHGAAQPWTRLGYTFDWGDPDGRVGLSEFVVMAGTTVVIESKTATASYGRDGSAE